MLSQDLISVVSDELLLSLWLLLLLLHAWWRSSRQVVCAQVRLQLLEKHEDQSDLVLLVEALNRSLFDLLQVQMHVLVAFKDVGRLIEDVVEELSHEESRSLVLFTGDIHLVLELHIVGLKQLVLILGPGELLLDLLELVLQEVDKVLILLVGSGIELIGASLTSSIGSSSVAHHRGLVSLLSLELFDLLLQSLDDLLAEMGPLGQLLLDLLMDLDIPLKCVDLSLHLAVLVEELLGLLRLVL